MPSTITLTGDWLANIGNKRQVNGTGNLGTYATNGVAVTATQVGLGVIEQLIIEPAGGYVFSWDKDNGKVLAYRTATLTPAGTNSQPTFTVNASGAIGASMEVGLSADSAAATFEGGTGITAQRILTTTSPVAAPTFTGTATTAAALAEVGNAVNLAAVTFRFSATGY